MTLSRGIVNALQEENKKNKYRKIAELIPNEFKKDNPDNINKIQEALAHVEKLNTTNDTSTTKNTLQEVLDYRDELKNTIDTIDEIENLSKIHGKQTLPENDDDTEKESKEALVEAEVKAKQAKEEEKKALEEADKAHKAFKEAGTTDNREALVKATKTLMEANKTLYEARHAYAKALAEKAEEALAEAINHSNTEAQAKAKQELAKAIQELAKAKQGLAEVEKAIKETGASSHKFGRGISIQGGGAGQEEVKTNDEDVEVVTKFIDDIDSIKQKSKDVINTFGNLVNMYNDIHSGVEPDKKPYFDVEVTEIKSDSLNNTKIKENAGPINGLNNNAKELDKSIKEFLDDNKKNIDKLQNTFKSSVKPLLSRYYKGTIVAGENKKIKKIFEDIKKDHINQRSELKKDFDAVFKKITGYANQVEIDAKKDNNQALLNAYTNRGRGAGGTGVEGGTEKEKDGDDVTSQNKTKDNLVLLKESMEKLKQKIDRRTQINDLGSDFQNISNIPDIYTDIYEKYIKKREEAETANEDERKGKLEEADQEFINDIERHKLLSKYAYTINTTDRLLFIVLILIIKTISMTIVEYCINAEWLQGIMTSIIIYCIVYLLIMTVVIYMINNSGIFMRSLMAYAHLEVNRGGLILHYVLILMFLIAIFVLHFNIERTDSAETTETIEDKIEMVSKIDMITNVIVVFCAVFVIAI